MIHARLGRPSDAVQQELEKLMNEWYALDTKESFAEYRDAHASKAALVSIQEANEAHEWAEKQGVLI